MGYLHQNPGKLVELATLLGHESLDTTAMYALLSEEDLAADVELSSYYGFLGNPFLYRAPEIPQEAAKTCFETGVGTHAAIGDCLASGLWLEGSLRPAIWLDGRSVRSGCPSVPIN